MVLVVLPLLIGSDRLLNKGERSPRLVYACSAVIAAFGTYWLLVRLGIVK
ncbi:hypothetical protein [Methylocystis sp. S23]